MPALAGILAEVDQELSSIRPGAELAEATARDKARALRKRPITGAASGAVAVKEEKDDDQAPPCSLCGRPTPDCPYCTAILCVGINRCYQKCACGMTVGTRLRELFRR
jgi:hypothetical protein